MTRRDVTHDIKDSPYLLGVYINHPFYWEGVLV